MAVTSISVQAFALLLVSTNLLYSVYAASVGVKDGPVDNEDSAAMPSDKFILRKLLQAVTTTQASTSGWNSFTDAERIGIIAGCVVGGLVIIAAIILICCCCCCRRRQRRRTVKRTRKMEKDDEGNMIRTTRTEITEINPKNRSSKNSNSRLMRNGTRSSVDGRGKEEPVNLVVNVISQKNKKNRLPRDTDSFSSDRQFGGTNPGFANDIEYPHVSAYKGRMGNQY